MRGPTFLLALLLGPLAFPVGARAQVGGAEEVMRQLFPDAERVERRTAFLTAEEQEEVARLAGREAATASALAPFLVALRDTAVVGWGYLDTREVRTLPATVLVAVGPDGRIAHMEVLVFREPPDYLPPDQWVAQLLGRGLGPELSLKGEIRGITGATLTARALTLAARRALALHRVLQGGEGS